MTDAKPPVAQTRPHRSEHHGVVLEDPYHWLRDLGYPKVTDAAVLDYLTAENAYFEAVMEPLGPLVDTLFGELKGRIKEDDWSVPVIEHGRAYQWRFDPGAQYRKWYRRPAEGEDGSGAETLLLDEPALAEGKEFFRLGSFVPSPDGRLLAYSADETGSERFTLYVKDLATGRLLDAPIPETLGAPVWSADGRVLCYVVVDEEWRPYQVRAHVLGGPVEPDRVLYEEADSGFHVDIERTQSEELLVIATGDHVTSEVRLLPTSDVFATPLPVSARSPGRQYEVDHNAERLFIRVNDTHKNFRVVTAPPDRPQPSHWQELIAGSDACYIQEVTAFEEFLVLEERLDGLDQIHLRRHDGSEHRIAFPDATYAANLGSNPGRNPSRLRIEYSSLARPATTWDYDLASRDLITRKVQEIPSGYDPSAYVTERLQARARDGAIVPISLVYRRDWQKGGPLHLYAYGAYGYGMPPAFSANRLSLLDRGFAYAIAHIRGGDELGYGWYEDGKLEKRENTFNDFIDAARHLIGQGYAAEGGISVSGGSAGGQLMGVVANRAPELWRAVVAHVPFVDALNTMLDDTLPLTPMEWPEWGNPITDKAAFDTIRGYSPYDNVARQAYPAIMVTAGLNDPRVTYWEPAKWVARLRAAKTGDTLLVLKTNMGAGHGGKSGRFERLREVAEEYAFILHAFGLA